VYVKLLRQQVVTESNKELHYTPGKGLVYIKC